MDMSSVAAQALRQRDRNRSLVPEHCSLNAERDNLFCASRDSLPNSRVANKNGTGQRRKMRLALKLLPKLF